MAPSGLGGGGGANVECAKVLLYAKGSGTAANKFPLVGVTLPDTLSPRNHFVVIREEPEAQQYLAASSMPHAPGHSLRGGRSGLPKKMTQIIVASPIRKCRLIEGLK